MSPAAKHPRRHRLAIPLRRGYRAPRRRRAPEARVSAPVRKLCYSLGSTIQQGWTPFDQFRHAPENSLKAQEGLAERDAAAVNAIFADRVFVRPGPLLDHRHCPSNPPERFKI